MQVVWFKRDLRITDHAPLVQALEHGPVLPLYILEPALWQAPDMSQRQFDFLSECIEDLHQALTLLGQGLVLRVGDAVSVLKALHQTHGIDALWSHQETWNGWTYRRDQAVSRYLKSAGITWHQPRQIGVIRGAYERNHWARQWHGHMGDAILSAPKSLPSMACPSEAWPKDWSLPEPVTSRRQVGGRRALEAQWQQFFYQEGWGYAGAISSPAKAAAHGSRLSPYLAFGVVSMREVYQGYRLASAHHALQSTHEAWGKSLARFASRLRWHCHFIQKLEDEPSLEFDCMHSAYQNLRVTVDEAKLHAWKLGQTGYPMIDACMRSLRATGWLNFRMRAMLVSFASYHLWLPWQAFAPYLAQLFIDYEPGIHYAQIQMQSATTGMNTMRIYNPIKQGMDQDPGGQFIKRWVPELRAVPSTQVHTPWAVAPEYARPIVDEKEARQAALKRLAALRKKSSHREEARDVVAKHGSRRRVKKPKGDPRQGTLPF